MGASLTYLLWPFRDVQVFSAEFTGLVEFLIIKCGRVDVGVNRSPGNPF